jgi:dimethylhistidine N-methyltransferase
MSRALPPRTRLDPHSQVSLYDRHPTPADLRAEVLQGLSGPQKRLSPKFFYDRKGSLLFDAITELPQYYPTRTEIGILREHGEAMAGLVGKGRVLIELGSGSSLKIQILLAALAPSVYVPVDISRDHLLASAGALAERFPGLCIRAVCADYSVPLDLPLDPDGPARAAFFPGSSIGNFEPPQARALLDRVGQILGPGGRLLIGVDLVKDCAVLEAAYNDSQGVTAEFNRNLLARINREIQGDFDLDAFAHQAFFNPSPDPSAPAGPGRIEMHLVSTREQWVHIGDRTIAFRAGESIHTENSYKYDLPGFGRLAADAGFATEQVWTDPEALFSVHCLRSAVHSDTQ